MQAAHAFTRLPSYFVHCKLGSKRFIEALMEWLRLIVFEYPLPQIAHILGIIILTIVKYISDQGLRLGV